MTFFQWLWPHVKIDIFQIWCMHISLCSFSKPGIFPGHRFIFTKDYTFFTETLLLFQGLWPHLQIDNIFQIWCMDICRQSFSKPGIFPGCRPFFHLQNHVIFIDDLFLPKHKFTFENKQHFSYLMCGRFSDLLFQKHGIFSGHRFIFTHKIAPVSRTTFLLKRYLFSHYYYTFEHKTFLDLRHISRPSFFKPGIFSGWWCILHAWICAFWRTIFLIVCLSFSVIMTIFTFERYSSSQFWHLDLKCRHFQTLLFQILGFSRLRVIFVQNRAIFKNYWVR